MLETERLILRTYKESDIDDYFKYVSNPKIGPMCGWVPYNDKQKAFERLKIEIAKPHQFAIVWKATNQVIGSIELMNTKFERYPFENIDKNSKEIGFLLSEEFWGKGIMPEAANKIMQFAFENLNVPEICICHAEANKQSKKVQEKLGFQVIGLLKNHRTWLNGNQTDLICRKITKEQWQQKHS